MKPHRLPSAVDSAERVYLTRATCHIIPFSNQVRDFLKYVALSAFDIDSVAFAAFEDLLTRRKVLVADFSEENDDAIFETAAT